MLSIVKVDYLNSRRDGKDVHDTNGNQSVVFTGIAGAEVPRNARVLNGTIAKNSGLLPNPNGQPAIFQILCQITGHDPEHGAQYRITNLGATSVGSILTAHKDTIMGVIGQQMVGNSYNTITQPQPQPEPQAQTETPVETEPVQTETIE